MSVERRLHPRAVVRLLAEIRRGTDEPEAVLLYDLSAGGAAVHTRAPLSIQTEVRLRFRLPGDDADLHVAAMVVRTGRPAQPDRERPYLAGLHFLDLHGEPFERLRGWIWSRLHPGPSD